MANHTTEKRIHESDLNNESNTATYCPEDNKIRIYIDGGDGRVERETYNLLAANRFKATPKQDCSFVATWSTVTEDIALALIAEGDEIGDEDQSPQERAFDRATRFAEYRDKRRAEANSLADTFEAGPSAFGNQNRRRAERQAARHNRTRVHSLTQWDKAEYWQSRTAGVIDHSLYKSEPGVRRRRILEIEKEQRKHDKSITEAQERWDKWEAVAELNGADTPLEMEDRFMIKKDSPKAHVVAAMLTNTGHHWTKYMHPRQPEVETTLYDLLRMENDPITPREAAELYAADYVRPGSAGTHSWRWSNHYKNRLYYENAMIEADGGKASELEMAKGGWIKVGGRRCLHTPEHVDGWAQIVAVNKSPATGRVCSVSVMGRLWYGKPTDKLRRITVNVESAGAEDGIYRPPTEEDLKAFEATTKKQRAKTKKANAAKPKLINPTLEDAKKLQAIINSQRDNNDDNEVIEMTQANYSAQSKGAYRRYETKQITEKLEIYNPSYYGGSNQTGQTPVFKLRMKYQRVIVITDKPQKPIPFDAASAIADSKPTVDEVLAKLDAIQPELTKAGGRLDKLDDEARQAYNDAEYHDLAYHRSSTQWGLTEAGIEALRKWRENNAETVAS